MLTVCVSEAPCGNGSGAGVDSAWEQKKLEADYKLIVFDDNPTLRQMVLVFILPSLGGNGEVRYFNVLA